MSYILIGQESSTMPYAISVEEGDVSKALEQIPAIQADAQRHLFYPSFLVDLNNRSIYRVVQDDSDLGWGVVDAAYDVVGKETPDEYFQEPETMEMDL